MNCMIYADTIWGLDDAYIEIGELRALLGGYRELIVDTCKDSGVGTHEFIYGASNYNDILGGGCIKVVKIMVYVMIDKT